MRRFAWIGSGAVTALTALSVACGNDYDATNNGLAPTPTDYESTDSTDVANLEIDPSTEPVGEVAYDPSMPIEQRVDQNDDPIDSNPEPPGATSMFPGSGGASVVPQQPYIPYDGETVDPPLGQPAIEHAFADPTNPPTDGNPKVDSKGQPIWYRNVYTVTLRSGMQVKCWGSLYNCEMPNEQWGRRRFLPQTVDAQIDTDLKTIPDATTRGEKIHTELEAKGNWPLKAGTSLLDGLGVIRGVVQDSTVRINFGQKKTMPTDGQTYVYAWDVQLTAPDKVTYAASGWVPLASITNAELSRKMPVATPPIPRAKTFAVSSKTGKAVYYTLKTTDDYPCTGGYLPATCLPKWTSLNVAPDMRNASNLARYFFLREGNVANLNYSTPWASTAATDTFYAATNVVFQRLAASSHHQTILHIPLFKAGQHKVVGNLVFLYGLMNGRWGWVNASALKIATPTTAACDGQNVGVQYCDPNNPLEAEQCTATGFENLDVCTGSTHCSELDSVTHQAAIDANGKVVCDPD